MASNVEHTKRNVGSVLVCSLALLANVMVCSKGYSAESSGEAEITGDVVEFYHPALDHYFLTANPAEQASIDAGGSGPGWTRTGYSFKSGGVSRVCRFYGTPGIGPNSHFYTVDPAECAQVKQDPGWHFESYDFSATPPSPGGVCPSDTVPVYRAYNNRFAQNDSNHRYTTIKNLYDAQIAKGWRGEGVVFCVPGAAQTTDYDLVALWEANTAAGNDSFYTIDYEQKHDIIVGEGYIDRGIAAWLPCSSIALSGPGGRPPNLPSPFHNQLGYLSFTNVPMSFSCARPANSAPFYRLSRNTPTNHFYTTSEAEAESALSDGWQFDRVEGYLFTTQVAGSTPLYRLSRCAPTINGCSIEHRYTLSTDAHDALRREGWADEGIEGYAFAAYSNPTACISANGNVNGLATSVNNPLCTSIQKVSPPKDFIPINGIDTPRPAATVSGYLISNSTDRPAAATRQRLTFLLHTGTLFDPGSNIDHIPVFLRFHSQLGSDGFPGLPYDGLGIFFSLPNWNNNQCQSSTTSGAQIFVERVANASRIANGTAAMEFVDCSANLSAPLPSNGVYSVSVTVTDDARLAYTVTDPQSGRIVADFPFHDYRRWYTCPLSPQASDLSSANAYCAGPMSPDRFANFRTGYLFWPLFTPQPSNAQGAIEGMTVQWLDDNDTVLSSE